MTYKQRYTEKNSMLITRNEKDKCLESHYSHLQNTYKEIRMISKRDQDYKVNQAFVPLN